MFSLLKQHVFSCYFIRIFYPSHIGFLFTYHQEVFFPTWFFFPAIVARVFYSSHCGFFYLLRKGFLPSDNNVPSPFAAQTGSAPPSHLIRLVSRSVLVAEFNNPEDVLPWSVE